MNTFPNPGTQFQPGQSGNPAGKPKGTKHISTWINEMLNDESFEANILDPKIGIKAYKGAPMRAIITVAVTRAINGDNRWADWLGKYGYGTKTDVTTNGKDFPTPILNGMSTISNEVPTNDSVTQDPSAS